MTTTEEAEFIEANLDVNEGTNDYNENLINKLKQSRIGENNNCPSSKFCLRAEPRGNDFVIPRLGEYNTSRLPLRSEITPKMLNVTNKLNTARKLTIEEEAGQQGSSLSNTVHVQKTLTKGSSMTNLTAGNLK